MKKLFVLFLCLVAVAGFVSAGAVHPPGPPALEMALSGYGVDCCAVAPDTVLVMEMSAHGLSGQILVVSDMILSGLPQIIFIITIDDPVLPGVSATDVDYPLRL